MRRTRFMSLFFLALSAAFFCVEDFRWALETPLVSVVMSTMYEPGSADSRVAGFVQPSSASLAKVRASAEQARDGEKLAFIALRDTSLDQDTRMRLVEQAVALNPALSWLYFQTAGNFGSRWGEPRLRAWAQKLEAFDPDNCVPYLFEADQIRAAGKWDLPASFAEAQRKALSEKTEWRRVMEQAFTRHRVDDYAGTRFLLERKVLQDLGWRRPSALYTGLPNYYLPNLLAIRQFADLQVNFVAREAEKAGKRDEAARIYGEVVAFGQMARTDAANYIEQLIGLAVERIGTTAQAASWRAAGQVQQAGALEFRARQLGEGGLREPLLRSATNAWAGLLLNLFSFLVVLFAAATAASIAYVTAKRWIRPHQRGRFWTVITVAENYLPILLFICCMALYLTYEPYAINYKYYLTTNDPMHFIEPFLFNVYPLPEVLVAALPLPRPFMNYIEWALALGAVAAVFAGLEEWRFRRSLREEPAKSQAAGS